MSKDFARLINRERLRKGAFHQVATMPNGSQFETSVHDRESAALNAYQFIRQGYTTVTVEETKPKSPRLVWRVYVNDDKGTQFPDEQFHDQAAALAHADRWLGRPGVKVEIICRQVQP